MRRENDNYQTPEWAVNALLENHRLPFPIGRVLEPCAGSGAIIEAFVDRWRGSGVIPYRFTAVEADPKAEEELRFSGASKLCIADFLTWEPDEEYSLIITNPPYSLAQQILERALEIARRQTKPAEVIMLLRLGFLQAQERHEFWQKNPVNHLYILSARPSFTGGGTDNCGYAWFVFDHSHSQSIKWVDSPTRPGKKKR